MAFSSAYKLSLFEMAVVLVVLTSGCRNKSQSNLAVEAKDALSTFQVADGFKIEMIA